MAQKMEIEEEIGSEEKEIILNNQYEKNRAFCNFLARPVLIFQNS
jgi:hypothetical protein